LLICFLLFIERFCTASRRPEPSVTLRLLGNSEKAPDNYLLFQKACAFAPVHF
jgi:hypothetical protein